MSVQATAKAKPTTVATLRKQVAKRSPVLKKNTVKPSPQPIEQIDRFPLLQAKLTINAPNDRYEREADAVAEHVLHMPESSESAFRHSSDIADTPYLQREAIEEEELQTASILTEEDESESVQTAEKSVDNIDDDDGEELQRKGRGDVARSAGKGFENRLRALRSAGGRAMDAPLQRYMESRFRRDFSHVRIHTGSAAEQLAEQASARAFTVGRHLVFGRGEYRPGIEQGRRLVAHELTHVLQQQGGLHSVQREILNPERATAQSDNDLLQNLRRLMGIDGHDVPVEIGNFTTELIGLALRSPDGSQLHSLLAGPPGDVTMVRCIETGDYTLELTLTPQNANAIAQWSLSRLGENAPFYSSITNSPVSDANGAQQDNSMDVSTLLVATPSRPQFSDASSQNANGANALDSVNDGALAEGTSRDATPLNVPANLSEASGNVAEPATSSAASGTTVASESSDSESTIESSPAGGGGASAEVEILMPEPPQGLSNREQARVGQVRSNASAARTATTDMPAAQESVGEARGAVDEPVEETTARAQGALVEALGVRPEPSPEIEELCLRIYDVIRSKRPVDEDALVEADPTDMAASAGREMNQSIENDVDAVGSSYNELQQPQSGTPAQVSSDMQTPPSSVSTPGLNATSATPDGVAPEAVDLGADVAASQQRISDAGMDSEVASQIQDAENPIVAGRDAQSGLAEVAERDPAEVLAEQEGVLAEASTSMADLQTRALEALASSRSDTAGSTTGLQVSMVGSEEDMRKNASDIAQAKFTKAQEDVRDLLEPLTRDAMAKWNAGVAIESTKFEQKLKRVEDWIEERHSGGLGAIVGVWDSVTGLPGWVTEEYDEAEQAFGDGVCDLIRRISVDVNLVIAAAEAIIETTRTAIAKVFSDLPVELQGWATEQQQGFSTQLDGLQQEARNTRDNFNQEISQSASAAVDEVRARVQTLREEAGGLIGKIADAVNDFLDDPVKFIIEGLLKLVGIPPPSFWALVNRIGQVINDIADDPLGFANNMAAALAAGFRGFFDRFVDHIMGGFFEWLFSGLGSVGVEIPTDTSLKSIITFFLGLMGITWPRIKALLGRHIGEENIELIEKAYELVSTLIEQGPEGIFEMIKEQLDPANIMKMVMDAAIDFMIEALVKAVTPRVIAMFNPAGAIIQAVEVIFRILKWVFENAARIFKLIETVVNGAADLIAGNIAGMAAAVETSLAGLISPVIDFLAGFLGMGDLPEKIADTIRGFQEWVMSILERVVKWLADRGKALLARLGFGGEDEQEEEEDEIKERISMDGAAHTLTIKISTKEVRLASTDAPLDDQLDSAFHKVDELNDDTLTEPAKTAITKMRASLAKIQEELNKTRGEGEVSVDRSLLREFSRETKRNLDDYGDEFTVKNLTDTLVGFGPVLVAPHPARPENLVQPDGSSRESHHVPPKELAISLGTEMEGTARALDAFGTGVGEEAAIKLRARAEEIKKNTNGNDLAAISLHRVTHQNAGGVAVHAAAMREDIVAAIARLDQDANTKTIQILNKVSDHQLAVNPTGAAIAAFLASVNREVARMEDEEQAARQSRIVADARNDIDSVQQDNAETAEEVTITKANRLVNTAFQNSYTQAAAAIGAALANSILDGPAEDARVEVGKMRGLAESTWKDKGIIA